MDIDFLSLIYSLSLVAGGIIGYTKAGSTGSLAAGIIFGSLLLYGTVQTSQDRSNCGLSLVVSAIVAGVMGNRFFNTRKFMPAGLVMCLSLMMVIRFGIILYRKKDNN